MKPEDVPQTWAVMAGAEVLANLFDRRGIKQALWEIDEETLSEMRETIGRAALAAVIPLVREQEREACAKAAEEMREIAAALPEITAAAQEGDVVGRSVARILLIQADAIRALPLPGEEG